MLARAHLARGALLARLGAVRLSQHVGSLHSLAAAPKKSSGRRQALRRPAATAAAAAESETEEAPEAPQVKAPGFKQLGVDSRLVGMLATQGIHEPTYVQRAAIPSILRGENSAVRSYTGSGKTLAYLLPALSLAVERAEQEWASVTRKTSGQAGTVQVLVVVPSRELAMQIMRVAQSLLPESARRGVQQAIGGANIWRQRENMKMFKPFMVVGTPGRLAELSREGCLSTHRTQVLILDEVDQLLAPQFREEMVRLCEHTGKKAPEGRQTLLVSATLTPRVLQMAQTWCPNATPVFVGSAPSAAVAAAVAEAAADAASAEAARQAAVAARAAGRASAAAAFHAANRVAEEGEVGAAVEPEDAADGTAGTLSEDAAADGTAAAAPAVPAAFVEEKRRPSWGWGDAKAPSADAADYNPGTSSAGGLGTEAAAAMSMPPQLQHRYVSSAPQHKVDMLRRSIHALDLQRALVFMNFQQRLKDTEGKLKARNMSVGSLHGDLTKQQRQTTLAAFRRGDFRVLVVSDVAARGLDIPDCDAVFHLELPTDASHYAHRAGRTGRAGRPGTVISLISGGEKFVLDKLGKKLGVDITEVEVSHGEMSEKP